MARGGRVDQEALARQAVDRRDVAALDRRRDRGRRRRLGILRGPATVRCHTMPAATWERRRCRSRVRCFAGTTGRNATFRGGAIPARTGRSSPSSCSSRPWSRRSIPYFERFIARFPDVASLAAAAEDEVTALWSGLGYYARARNLRRAAEAAVAEHGGAFRSRRTALRALPGIGPYTAAAVAAIAFGARTFALDGNAMRVLARLTRRAAAGGPARDAGGAARARAGGGSAPARGRLQPGRDGAGRARLHAAQPALRRLPARPPAAARAPRGWPRRCRASGRARRARSYASSAPASRTAARVLVIERGKGLLAGTWALPEAVDCGARSAARCRARAGRGDRRARRRGRLSRGGSPRVHASGRHRGAVSRRGGRLRAARPVGRRRLPVGLARRARGARSFDLRPENRGARARRIDDRKNRKETGPRKAQKRDTDAFRP